MSRNEYLTTGEVARMMGTTKNTLFHYDQLGIFSPEARGEMTTATTPSARWMC